MRAVRDSRYIIFPKDFDEAYKKVVKMEQDMFEFYNWILLLLSISIASFIHIRLICFVDEYFC